MFSENAAPLSVGLARHTILSSIARYNMKFRDNYGKIFIACDNKHYWRKDVFPYYKCKRKEQREDDHVDWNIVYEYVTMVKEELDQWMPYPVLEVPSCEADDIIFVLAPLVSKTEKVMIISRDHDLQQLQVYPGVEQYNPVEDRMEVCDDPIRFLCDHIVGGDSGDSVPNIFSPENSYAIKQRQKPATGKRKDAIWNDGKGINIPNELIARFHMNEKLVSHYFVPGDLKLKIIAVYEEKRIKNRDIFKYFQKFRLASLTQSIQEFI
jgi:hypothetical protein